MPGLYTPWLRSDGYNCIISLVKQTPTDCIHEFASGSGCQDPVRLQSIGSASRGTHHTPEPDSGQQRADSVLRTKHDKTVALVET